MNKHIDTVISETQFQEECRQFVDREVYYCQTALVDDLFRNDFFNYDDIVNGYVARVNLSDGEEEYNSQDEIDEKILQCEELQDEIDAQIEDTLDATTEASEALTDAEENDQDVRAAELEKIIDSLEHRLMELQKTRDILDDDIANLKQAEFEPEEVFEWWLVSDWLLYKLKEKGHPVLSNEYGTWWGRCTTGQAISIDHAIREIVSEARGIKTSGQY